MSMIIFFTIKLYIVHKFFIYINVKKKFYNIFFIIIIIFDYINFIFKLLFFKLRKIKLKKNCLLRELNSRFLIMRQMY